MPRELQGRLLSEATLLVPLQVLGHSLAYPQRQDLVGTGPKCKVRTLLLIVIISRELFKNTEY